MIILVFLIIIFFIITLYFTKIPNVNLSTSMSNHIFNYDINIHHNPFISGFLYQSEYDPCKNYFEYSCQIGSTTIYDIMNENNHNLIKNIEESKIKPSYFYNYCQNFHNDINKIKNIFDPEINKEYFKYVDLINNINKNTLEDTILILTKIGIKNINQIFIDINGKIILRGGERIKLFYHDLKLIEFIYNQQFNNLNDFNFFEEMNNDFYLKKETPIFIDNINNYNYLFNFTQIKDLSPLYIDLNYFYYFKLKKEKYTIKQWIKYLRVSLIYYTLKRFKINEYNMFTTENICIEQYKILFPLQTCRAIKNRLIDIDLKFINQITNNIKNLYLKWLDDNELEIEEIYINNAKIRLKNLEFFINECWVLNNGTDLKPYLTLLEENVINNHTNYIDIINNLYNNEKYQLFHNSQNYDDNSKLYSRDFISSFLTWSATYIYDKNIVIAGPGILYYIIKNEYEDSCVFKTLLGNVFGHEIFHLIYFEIYNTNSIKFNKIKNYFINKNGIDSIYENLADLFGAYINSKNFENLLENDKRCFFLSTIRVWCHHDSDNIHGNGFTRASIPFYFLKNKYENVFKCKF